MAGWAVGDLGSVKGQSGTWRLDQDRGMSDPGRVTVSNGVQSLTIPRSDFTNESMAGKKAGGGKVEGPAPKKRSDRKPRR